VKDPKQFESVGELYTVTRTIGEGGAGRVFEVKTADGHPHAIKVLRPEHVRTERRHRFRNELIYLRQNTHENIITVVDEGLVEWSGARTPFYVMPLFAGTLRTQLHDGKVAAATALQVFAQILDGVEAAHLHGVTHRDLKPENILFDPKTDRYVVADFGIAHFQDDELLTAVETQARERLANFLYAAPEQRVRGASVTARADQYALGLILNELFTGEVIQGTGYKKVSVVSGAHAYLDEIVEKMVRQSAGERYASLDDVKKELIGRHQVFVSQQALDAARKKVVPKFAPGVVAPVNVVGADWKEATLFLKLDREPEPGWVQCFQRPRGTYRTLWGAMPQNFYFKGNTAVIHQVQEQLAQGFLDQFKEYSQMATKSFQQDVNDAAAQKEANARGRLENERRAAEERARVLSKLKF
jgi:serine/threonine protein kinase